MSENDIGVPSAVAEALRQLRDRLPSEQLDRVWIFPPLADGRKESGVVAAGYFAGEDRRVLVTLSYRAEETGGGITFEASFREEGEAPKDRLPRVIEGVVERSGIGLGTPHASTLNGDAGALEELIEEWAVLAGDPQSQVASQVEPRLVSAEEVPR